ncbi:MAG: hypothetical protein ACTHJ0_01615 [Flavipsychrobacter sp.]
MKPFYIVAAVLAAMFWASCNIINPPEKTPTYVHIDSFAFNQPSAGLGSASHDITSVFVYYNHNPIGFFDLPVTFPVITSGDSGVITVSPAVTINGLYSFQSPYVYYSADTVILKTNPGKVFNYLPTTGYLIPFTHVPWSDNFDNGNDFTNVDSSDKRSLITDHAPADAFEGAVGRVDLSGPDTAAFIVAAGHPFKMDVNGQTYLELNYKCSATFQIGVSSISPVLGDGSQFLVGANPSPNVWKKLYVSLQTVAQQYPNSQYYILIKFMVPPGQSGGFVLLDNLKVVGDE